jgi:hypothetical protein
MLFASTAERRRPSGLFGVGLTNLLNMKSSLIVALIVIIGLYISAMGIISYAGYYWEDLREDTVTFLDVKIPNKLVNQGNVNVSDFESYIEWSRNKTFHIDDSYFINQLDSDISCLPNNWGHSKEEGEKIFPYYQYPLCKNINPYPNDEVLLDPQLKAIKIHCENNVSSSYILGPTFKSVFYAPYKNRFTILDYQNFTVNVSKKNEWVLASCHNSQNSSDYKLGDIHPTFNPSSYSNAISLSKNDRYNPRVPILYLVLDSFSRRHFYRKLPKTLSFLENLSRQGEYGVFDFKMHNIVGSKSIDNMSVVLTGMNKRTRKEAGPSNDIWVLLRKLGFMTMVGQEDCSKIFAYTFGKSMNVDHSIQQFFCAANKYSKFTTKKKVTSTQRCIGNRMSHDYMLDYLEDFLDMYIHSSRWAYLHIDAAHEGTGQHAATLDESLVTFLEKAVVREDFPVIFLEADHGMRYGDWKRNEAGSQEWKLPAFWMLIPHKILKDIPNSYSNLIHNTYRLTTKYDIRQTMLSLAAFLKNRPINKDPIGIDLLTQRVMNNRTCEEMRIPLEYCSCMSFLEIEPYLLYNDIIKDSDFTSIRYLIFSLVEITIDKLNDQVNYNNETLRLCRSLKLKEILNSSISLYGGMVTVRVVISTSPEMVVESLFQITESDYGQDKIYFRDTLMDYKIVYLSRINEYNHTCEEVSQAFEIDPEFCLCDDVVIHALIESVKEYDSDK